MVAVDHRDRRSPITLARNEPVAEPELHLFFALAVFLEPLGGLGDRLFRGQAVKEAGVAGDAVGGHRRGHCRSVGSRFVDRTDDGDDGDIIFAREIEVALVVRGNAHDRPRTVIGEDIVGDPNRRLLPRDGVDGEKAGIHTLFIGADGGTLDCAARGHPLGEGAHLRGLFAARHLRELLHIGMFRGHRDEGDAKDRVNARRKGLKLEISIGDIHLEVNALGAAYPVALHRDDALRPALEVVEAVNQLLRVVRDTDEPLVEVALRDRSTAAPADAVVDDLLVGEHRLALVAPVDGRMLTVYEPFLVELQEEPLVPSIIVNVAGLHAAAPVVAIARVLELLRHMLDIAPGPVGGSRLILDSRVLRRHAEGVEAHRIEDV